MSRATPHRGVEPSVRPKTVVVGFTRVVVECLLALAELARREAAAVERMNVDKVGKAKTGKYNQLSTIETSTVRPSMRGIPYLMDFLDLGN